MVDKFGELEAWASVERPTKRFPGVRFVGDLRKANGEGATHPLLFGPPNP